MDNAGLLFSNCLMLAIHNCFVLMLNCLCYDSDLPQYGHKQWQSYFGRTFDVYTKLWKFQQQNRYFIISHFSIM